MGARCLLRCASRAPTRGAWRSRMKRPVRLVGLVLSLGLVVPGCPIYNEGGCQEDAHCAPGYVCELLTGECVEPSPPCDRPSDCSNGATCDREGQCRTVDC